MDVTLTDETPYRMSCRETEAVRETLADLLANGIIIESNSSYASLILLVNKKTGEFRLCVDYRILNRKAVKDAYLMPKVNELDR